MPPLPFLADITATAPSLEPQRVAVFSADQVLGPYVYVFYAAFIVSFLFTPIMRAVAMHYGVVDRPDTSGRKIHREPVAYLGGVAVFLGWVFSLAIARFVTLHRITPGASPHPQINPAIAVGALVIVFLGLWDDLKGVRPRLKIAAQVIAAGLLLSFGVGARCAAPILGEIGQRISLTMTGRVGVEVFPDWVVGVVSACLVIALVVGCCNATNLMDGLDGLCGGVTGIIAGGYVVLAVHLAMTGGEFINADGLRIILALALLGAVLGFIPYNFNPASIFMGDAGSMLLGYAIAIQIVLMAQDGGKWFLGAMVVFALPVLDTSLAFVRRYVNRRPFFAADRHHIHHQLMARGMTVRRTVLTLYALAIAFAFLGVSITLVRTRYAGAVYLVTFGSLIVAAYKMGMVHERAVVTAPKTIEASAAAAIATAPPVEPSGVLELPDPITKKQVELAPPPPPAPPSPPSSQAGPRSWKETG